MSVTLRGAEHSYEVDLSGTNVMCRIEAATGLAYEDALSALTAKRPRVSLLREFLRCALVTQTEVSLEEVGAILDDIGGAAVVQAAVRAARTPRGRRG